MTVDKRKGTCPVCGTFCHIVTHLEDGKVVKVESDNESVMGHLCIRGVNGVEYHDHPKRLNYPLKRTGARGEAKWAQISWEQAMDEIAAKLENIHLLRTERS